MKILSVTNMYPCSLLSYYGVFVKDEIEFIQRYGIDVDVFFINGRMRKLNYFLVVDMLVKKIMFNNYDLIHVYHTYCIPAVKLALIISRKKIPVILSFHEGETLVSSSKDKDKDLLAFLRYSIILKKFLIKKMDFVITVSQELIHKIFKKTDYIKYKTVPCGVNTKKFNVLDKVISREIIKAPFNKKIIFFPGDPNRRSKNFTLFNEAIKIMNSESIYLLVAGQIEHKLMPYYFNASDVIVQTSFYEASPTVIKEALACNIPIVSTDVGDVKNILHGVEGCYICNQDSSDIAYKINLALKYDKRTEGRARIFQSGLDLDSTAKKVIAIYNEVLVAQNRHS